MTASVRRCAPRPNQLGERFSAAEDLIATFSAVRGVDPLRSGPRPRLGDSPDFSGFFRLDSMNHGLGTTKACE
jgi:hypothetical protein